MKRIVVLMCGLAYAASVFPESGTLTIGQALELAKKRSPELRAGQLHTQAGEKEAGAAGLWENPEIELEAEGIGGDLDLFSEGEYTIGIEQKFLRGGKREKERAVALASVDVANETLLEKEFDLVVEVRRAFIELMAQQEAGKIHAEQEELGRAFVAVAKKRYDAGGGSELEVVQAELALEEIILLQTCCFGELKAAREQLASLTGIPAKEIAELSGAYYELETLDGLVVQDSHPALRRLEAQAEQIRAEARRAQAQDISDLSLGAGYKHEAAEGIDTFVLSASMPLGFAKRGQVESEAHTLRADAVLAEREEIRRKLHEELSTGMALYKGAKNEAEILANKLIQKAEQAYALSRAGYDAGRFSWLELIEAQQHLAEIRIRHIEALRDAHLIRAELSKFMKEGMSP